MIYVTTVNGRPDYLLGKGSSSWVNEETRMRETHEVKCPGTKEDVYVIVPTEWQCLYGVTGIMNVGECPLFLAPIGRDSKPIGGGANDIKLNPGDSIPQYFPPPETMKIVIGCHTECKGKGLFEHEAANA